MAKKTLAAVVVVIRQKLRDEEDSVRDLTWATDELLLKIDDVLGEISEASPNWVHETLQTSAASRELDISSIEDWNHIDEVEYPVGNDPKSIRNCEIVGNTLTILTNLLPSAGQDVYLYCAKLHQLTQSDSTLTPKLERLLVLGVSAYAAIDRAGPMVGKILVGGWRSPAQLEAWGQRQLGLYREGLTKITEERPYIDHPLS